MSNALMSFVTRCYARPRQLFSCITFLSRQTSPDYEHVILVDEVGIGVEKANGMFALPQNIERVRGKYVYIIDSDDIVTYYNLVSEIKQISEESDPDVIIVQCVHENGVPLPPDYDWLKYPVPAHVGSSSFVVRNEIWKEHIHLFGDSGVYHGDYIFACELFEHDYKFHWLQKVVAHSLRQNQGVINE